LLLRIPPDLPEGAGYVSTSPWVPLWLILVIALLVFAAAYLWTFRKLSKARHRQRLRLLQPVSIRVDAVEKRRSPLLSGIATENWRD
jgi:hypothetical protein